MQWIYGDDYQLLSDESDGEMTENRRVREIEKNDGNYQSQMISEISNCFHMDKFNV